MPAAPAGGAGAGVVMATREDAGPGWYPECGGVAFTLGRQSQQDLARHEGISAEAIAQADADIEAERIGIWTQIVRFLLGSNEDQVPQEPLRWRLAAAQNGACAVAKRGTSAVGICFAAAGGHARIVDARLDALSSVDECVWNDEGDLLACCCHQSSTVVVLRINVAAQTVPSAGQTVDLGPDRGVVASMHFRSASELVVVSSTAHILRVAVSGEPDVHSTPPAYFVSRPGEPATLSRTLRISGGAVQRAVLWRHHDESPYFWSKRGDVLTLACDDRLYMIGLLETEPFFERIRDLPVRAADQASPPMAVGFLTPLGTSRLVRRDRVAHLALSADGRHLATLTRGGTLVVRFAGLQFNPAEPTDLGNAVVARSSPQDGEIILDMAWWDNEHLLVARKNSATASRAALALVPLQDPIPSTSMLVESMDSALGRPLSLTSSTRSGQASALAFALSCDKQWLTEDEQRPPNATISVRGHFLLRHYRLSVLMARSPQELYSHHLARAEFDAAETLASTFGLDLDLLAKARWDHAPARSPETIKELLGAVRDLDWVLDRCASQLPPTEEATRALLSYGLDRCAAAPVELTPAQSELSAELAALRTRLDVFMAIRGKEGFDAVEFSIFRTRDLVRQAREAAEDNEIDTVKILCKAYPSEIAPVLLSVLSCFPETTSPLSYADLLPACADAAGSGGTYWVLDSAGDPSILFEGSGAPSLQEVINWYTHRIVEIDQASGMLDLALELSQCALVRIEACASHEAAQALFRLIKLTRELDRLVYQTGLRDSVALGAWVEMNDYERLCVALDGTRSANVVKVMSARVLAWYRDLEGPDLVVWLGHVRRYLRARARGLDDPRELPATGSAIPESLAYDVEEAREGIALCAEVIHQSRPLAVSEGGVARRDRLIPISTALIETALACCYASPVADAQESFDRIFQSLPARQREVESKVPALAALQDRVEVLDTFLDVNAQLAHFDAAVPLQLFADWCQAYEAKQAEELLATGLVQEEDALLEHLMTGKSTQWLENDARSEFVATLDPGDLTSVVTSDCPDGSERPAVNPGNRLALRVLGRAARASEAGREYWDRALAAVWSLRRALPYLSRRFLARACLLTLLRAGQFDVANEFIINMDEAAGENAILAREEMEDLVIEVSQEFFNSSADFGSSEMHKAQQVLKTLPFAASQRVRTEANLVQILDLLSNELETPMVPLQVRMFINSSAPEEIIDRVLDANPLLYKRDSKLLRLASLMGLESPDQSAGIRLRVVRVALAQGDCNVARRLVDAMIEKANYLLSAASQENSEEPAPQILRTAQVSARACLALAQCGLLQSAEMIHDYAINALLLATDGKVSVEALRLAADTGTAKVETPAPVSWGKGFDASGIEAIRQQRGSFPVQWAVAELAHDPTVASMALAELLLEDPSRSSEVEAHLDSLEDAMNDRPEASSKQAQIVHGALRALAICAAQGPEQVAEALQSKSSRLMKLVQPEESGFPSELRGLAARLRENCRALSDSDSLLRLVPGVNVSLFQRDEKYRKRSLMDAARALGHRSAALDGEEWQGLAVLAESVGGASAWDLDAARVTGLVLSGAPAKELEAQLRKDEGVARMLAEPASAHKVLGTLWKGISGSNFDQLAMVESLMLRAFDVEGSSEGNTKEDLESEKQRLRDRRFFLRRLDKLASAPLDAKRFLGAPLAPPQEATVDRELALEETVIVLDKKTIKRVAKLMSTNVECKPALRPSEIVLHYCSHLLGLAGEGKSPRSEDEEGEHVLTEVAASAARAARQTYSATCADLVKILVPRDAATLAHRCAARGGRRDLLDLDLRERIVEDCMNAFEAAIARKAPEEGVEESRQKIEDSLLFLCGLRFLSETLDLSRQPLVSLMNELERSDLRDDRVTAALCDAMLAGACPAEILVRACAKMGKSPVGTFESITQRVLVRGGDGAMDDISALVTTTAHLVDFGEDTGADERATGEAMLAALRAFASSAKSERVRIDLLKLLSIVGLDQAGDQILLQDLKAVRAVQEIWPGLEVAMEQVSGVEQRLALLDARKVPVDAVGRRQLANVLLEWDGLSEHDLALGDFLQAADAHARHMARKLISGYFPRGSEPEDSAPEDDGDVRTSPYASTWAELFDAAFRSESDDSTELLLAIRYGLGGDSLSLLTADAEVRLFDTFSTAKFGLLSGYSRVRAMAKETVSSITAEDLDEEMTLLVLSTCSLVDLAEPIVKMVSEVALGLSARAKNPLARPFSWSPAYLALGRCFRREFVSGGMFALSFGGVPTSMRVGSAWHVALRHLIMQTSLAQAQGAGWGLAPELASAAQALFNKFCCQDRDQEPAFSVTAYEEMNGNGHPNGGPGAGEDDDDGTGWNASWGDGDDDDGDDGDDDGTNGASKPGRLGVITEQALAPGGADGWSDDGMDIDLPDTGASSVAVNGVTPVADAGSAWQDDDDLDVDEILVEQPMPGKPASPDLADSQQEGWKNSDEIVAIAAKPEEVSGKDDDRQAEVSVNAQSDPVPGDDIGVRESGWADEDGGLDLDGLELHDQGNNGAPGDAAKDDRGGGDGGERVSGDVAREADSDGVTDVDDAAWKRSGWDDEDDELDEILDEAHIDGTTAEDVAIEGPTQAREESDGAAVDDAVEDVTEDQSGWKDEENGLDEILDQAHIDGTTIDDFAVEGAAEARAEGVSAAVDDAAEDGSNGQGGWGDEGDDALNEAEAEGITADSGAAEVGDQGGWGDEESGLDVVLDEAHIDGTIIDDVAGEDAGAAVDDAAEDVAEGQGGWGDEGDDALNEAEAEGITADSGAAEVGDQGGWGDEESGLDEVLDEAHIDGTTINDVEAEDVAAEDAVKARDESVGAAVDDAAEDVFADQGGWGDDGGGLDVVLDEAHIDETIIDDVAGEDAGAAVDDAAEDVAEGPGGWGDEGDDALNEAEAEGITADSGGAEVGDQVGWGNEESGLDEVLDEAHIDGTTINDVEAEDVAAEDAVKARDESVGAADSGAAEAVDQDGWGDEESGLDEVLDEAHIDGTTIDDIEAEEVVEAHDARAAADAPAEDGSEDQGGWGDEGDDDLNEAEAEGITADSVTAEVEGQDGWGDDENGLDEILDEAHIDSTTAEDVAAENAAEARDEGVGAAVDDAAEDNLDQQGDRGDEGDDVLHEAEAEGITAGSGAADNEDQGGWEDDGSGLDEVLDEAHIDGSTADNVAAEEVAEDVVENKDGQAQADDEVVNKTQDGPAEDNILIEKAVEGHVDNDKSSAAQEVNKNEGPDGWDDEILDEKHMPETPVTGTALREHELDEQQEQHNVGWGGEENDDLDPDDTRVDDRGGNSADARTVKDAIGAQGEEQEVDEWSGQENVVARASGDGATANTPAQSGSGDDVNTNGESVTLGAEAGQADEGWGDEGLDVDDLSSTDAHWGNEHKGEAVPSSSERQVEAERVGEVASRMRGLGEDSRPRKSRPDAAGAETRETDNDEDRLGGAEDDGLGANNNRESVGQGPAAAASGIRTSMQSDDAVTSEEANQMPSSEDAGVRGQQTGAGPSRMPVTGEDADDATSHTGDDASGSTIGRLSRALEHMDLDNDPHAAHGEHPDRATWLAEDDDASGVNDQYYHHDHAGRQDTGFEELAGEDTGGAAAPSPPEGDLQSMSEMTAEQRSPSSSESNNVAGESNDLEDGEDAHAESGPHRADASQSAGVDVLAEPAATAAAAAVGTAEAETESASSQAYDQHLGGGAQLTDAGEEPAGSACADVRLSQSPPPGGLSGEDVRRRVNAGEGSSSASATSEEGGGPEWNSPELHGLRAGGATGEGTQTWLAPSGTGGTASGAGETSAGGSSPQLMARGDAADAWGLSDDLDLDSDEPEFDLDASVPQEGIHAGNDAALIAQEDRVAQNWSHDSVPSGAPLEERAARSQRTQSGQSPYDSAASQRAANADEGEHERASAAESTMGPGAVGAVAASAAAAATSDNHELDDATSALGSLPAQSAGDQEADDHQASGWDDDDLDLDGL